MKNEKLIEFINNSKLDQKTQNDLVQIIKHHEAIENENQQLRTENQKLNLFKDELEKVYREDQKIINIIKILLK